MWVRVPPLRSVLTEGEIYAGERSLHPEDQVNASEVRTVREWIQGTVLCFESSWHTVFQNGCRHRMRFLTVPSLNPAS